MGAGWDLLNRYPLEATQRSENMAALVEQEPVLTVSGTRAFDWKCKIASLRERQESRVDPMRRANAEGTKRHRVERARKKKKKKWAGRK